MIKMLHQRDGMSKDNSLKKWVLVAAARPNFMKIAPLVRAIETFNAIHGRSIDMFLVHTGQHYDENMSESFFVDLNIPVPHFNLGIGSGNHGEQTGQVMIAFEKVLLNETPSLVIVVGDVNSTMACSLAAVKLHIPVAHVEAGLRSFDRRMPEEINRIVTDAVADYLFTPSPDGDENLLKEGISPEKIFLVGDIMVDSLLYHLERAKASPIREKLSLMMLPDQAYGLLTLHRPSNVDNSESFKKILQGLLAVSVKLPILFSIHPRTRKMIHEFGLHDHFIFHASQDLSRADYYENGYLKRAIHCFEPMGYLDFLNLMSYARVVLTDSGGIQEETTVLNVPCITLRDTTERPITLTQGTNILVHDDPERIVAEVANALSGRSPRGVCPAIWDGRTAERIVNILAERMAVRKIC